MEVDKYFEIYKKMWFRALGEEMNPNISRNFYIKSDQNYYNRYLYCILLLEKISINSHIPENEFAEYLSLIKYILNEYKISLQNPFVTFSTCLDNFIKICDYKEIYEESEWKKKLVNHLQDTISYGLLTKSIPFIYDPNFDLVRFRDDILQKINPSIETYNVIRKEIDRLITINYFEDTEQTIPLS